MDSTLKQQLDVVVDTFAEPGRQLLATAIESNFTGQLKATTALSLAEALTLTPNQLLHALVPLARVYALPPISNYHVGTAVRATNGDIFLGGNLEFPGMPLNLTVHGEQAAIVNAFLHGADGIEALAVGGTPCGHCRQFLAEINNPDLAIVAPDGSSRPLSDALPNAFMPMALGNSNGMLDDVSNDIPPAGNNTHPLLQLATTMAARSYAPYSHAWAGAAARLRDGTTVQGAYLESVAFNPSLSAIQVLLVDTRMRGWSWDAIEEIALVENKDAPVDHAPVARALTNTLNLAAPHHLQL